MYMYVGITKILSVQLLVFFDRKSEALELLLSYREKNPDQINPNRCVHATCAINLLLEKCTALVGRVHCSLSIIRYSLQFYIAVHMRSMYTYTKLEWSYI